MRYMEHQLKTERFVEDQEQRVAKFLPSRETSLDEMIEKEHRQFAAEQPSWEDELLHQELICRLHSAIKLLEQSERELILAIYFEGLTERQLARRADLHHMTIHSRKIRILQKLKNLLKK
ncbi:sigma-70, region 4 [Clostridium sp. ATCC BAA-442]|nr:sigma-70, region 4 [Clostridium sp. ATCC BAA-442]